MLASELVIHILNFIAPALWMACFLVLSGHFIARGESALLPWPLAWLVVALVGVATLLVGLWLAGRDGKMATYIALVLSCGSAQWLLSRSWRA
jgi:hypothetical protein